MRICIPRNYFIAFIEKFCPILSCDSNIIIAIAMALALRKSKLISIFEWCDVLSKPQIL